MKKVIAVVLVLTTILCLVGCNKKIKDNRDASSRLESGYTETEDEVAKTDASSSENSKNQSSVKPSSGVDSQNNNKNNSTNEHISNNKGNSTDNNLSSNVTTEKVKINSLDQLNFYAVKRAIADNRPIIVLFRGALINKNKISRTAFLICRPADFFVLL